MPDDTAPMKARPTTYKGVRMRSRLEAGFAQWLDAVGLEWEYEPECFADASGQYLPDFRTTFPVLESGRVTPYVTYVEVKPKSKDREFVMSLLRRMAVIHSSEPDAVLAVAAPDRPGRMILADSNVLAKDDCFLFDLLDAATHEGPKVVLGTPLPPSVSPWTGEWWVGGD